MFYPLFVRCYKSATYKNRTHTRTRTQMKNERTKKDKKESKKARKNAEENDESEADDDDYKDETCPLDPKTAAVFKRKGYRIENKLSEGAYGQVYKGRNLKTGESVAIKVMNLRELDPVIEQRFWPRECEALKRIRHPNVIAIHDIIRANNRIYSFMEFANEGDLCDYLKRYGAMSEPLAGYWFRQVSLAVCYMHRDLRMAHRDIKVDNVLLHNAIAKLTDFGFARFCWDPDRNEPIRCETICGTEPYHSPQLMREDAYDAYAADCWAAGVTLFVMINDRFPFRWTEGDAKTMLREQLGAQYRRAAVKKLTVDLRDLFDRLFAIDEKKRIKMTEVVEHPWIVRRGKSRKSAKPTEDEDNSKTIKTMTTNAQRPRQKDDMKMKKEKKLAENGKSEK